MTPLARRRTGEETSNLAFLVPTLTYDANDAFLTLTRNATLFQSVALTPNQQSVAHARDQFPTANPLFLAVLNQSASGDGNLSSAIRVFVFDYFHDRAGDPGEGSPVAPDDPK
jgi:hypothetical protein